MHLLRLSGRKVCERVKTKGFLWKGKHMQIRWLRGQPRNTGPEASAGLYVGLLTSAKLHKSAVKRNRMRRRCREALRITVASIDENKAKRQEGKRAKIGEENASCLFAFLPFCLSSSYQLLLLPRSSSLSADFRELIADIDRFLSSL